MTTIELGWAVVFAWFTLSAVWLKFYALEHEYRRGYNRALDHMHDEFKRREIRARWEGRLQPDFKEARVVLALLRGENK